MPIVEGCVSVAGFGAASKFFLVFLFLTGLGRCVGFVMNLGLNLSAAICCLDDPVLDPLHVSFWVGLYGHQQTPLGIVCNLSLFKGDWMFTLSSRGVLSGTVFPMFSCITLLLVFMALKVLSKSHCISGMLQHCVLNMSIFGSGADIVITVSSNLVHP